METLKINISEEFLQFGADIIVFTDLLNIQKVNYVIINQLLRSGTSAGANYEEACGAESRADFVHKLHISYKELRETNYWLRLIWKSGKVEIEKIKPVIERSELLLNVLSKSLITSKRNSQKVK
ncbi:MAG: four helix bundle protein [Bacteroidales bacterium]|nr:four helix bundle protein [Lentimicrobiaceae bacterium]MDD5694038.1 four helix bundle protein [Bacteroidales bacterium]